MATGTGSIYILGPSMLVTEPIPGAIAPTPEMAGRVGISYHPTTPYTPGGLTTVRLLAPVAAGDVRPTHVHAIMVTPPASVPAGSTAEWFLATTGPKGSTPVPQPPLDASADLVIQVAPLPTPGLYFHQTVLEYAG